MDSASLVSRGANHGLTFTKQDLAGLSNLSDEDLEAVAGGIDPGGILGSRRESRSRTLRVLATKGIPRQRHRRWRAACRLGA